MVDAADRLGISGCPMDRLSLSYVFTTSLASFVLGPRNQLGYLRALVFLAHSDLQIQPLAAGVTGTLADAMGASNAKTLN